MLKQQASDDSKSEYALELQKTNNGQREHYETVMPQIFQVFHSLYCQCTFGRLYCYTV